MGAEFCFLLTPNFHSDEKILATCPAHRSFRIYVSSSSSKGKGLPQQAEVAQGVPGRLRPRIFLTFGTTRVVGRQPYASAAFTPGEIPGTHF